ncbi:MAG: zinc ribbon domain-containing protein [Spirochaetaceae bacterium]
MTRSRFFCENCGAEVRPHAKVCPKCGRFFSAVRCPQCGHTGEGKEFLHGCPNCGYSGSGLRGGGRGAAREEWYDAADLEKSDGESTASFTRTGWSRRRRSAPPGWVYWLALGLVTLAFIAMVIIYVRMA